MSGSGRSLRATILAAHMVVALSGALTFLVVSGLLILTMVPGLISAGLTPPVLLVVAVATFAGAGVAALVGRVATGRLYKGISTPLRELTAGTRRLSRGHLGEKTSGRSQPISIQQPIDDESIRGLIAAFQELRDSLEAAERRRIEVFGEVTHELRTPVAILEGYIEGLLDGHVKPSEKTWAMLYDEASRVHRLVDELQDLSRAEARQEPPDLQAVDPRKVAEAALDRLRLHFQEKGLEVMSDIRAGLPQVLADPDHVLQVLVNLLTNSLRYTPVPGQVTLSVSGPVGNELVFRVADTGVGIAAEHIPHLFERFFRVDRSTSRAVGGSGIGLPVAKALVEGMGGRIWAESPGVGKGSTFSFTLLVATEA